jgi:hypothetical protein
MTFSAVFCFGCLALCTGGAIVCLACYFLARVFHRHCLASRLTLFYFFLSGAVVLVAALFFFTTNPLKLLPLQTDDLLFFLCLLFIGGTSAFFWKTVFPVVLLCYLILSFFTGIKLYTLFGTTLDTHEITITADSVYVDGSRFLVNRRDQEYIVLDVSVIPDRLLLPLPRVWFSVAGVADELEKPGAVFPDEKNGFRRELFNDSNVVSRFISKYLVWLVHDHGYQYVRLPDFSCSPAVYTLSCKVRNKTVYCSFSKTL